MPDLRTARLLLRALTTDEARTIRSGGTPAGLTFAAAYPLPDTYDGLGLFLRHGDERWGFSLVVPLEDRIARGDLPRKERGQGYATEAIAVLSDWALAQPEVGEVRAQTLPDNEASIRALLRAGFEETHGNEKLRRFRRGG